MADEELFEADINLHRIDGSVLRTTAIAHAKNKRLARKKFESHFIPIEVRKVRRISKAMFMRKKILNVIR